jgi:uncharacterized protein (TIGR03067 family)
MKRWTFLALLLSLVEAHTVLAGSVEDLKRLQGTWLLVAGEKDGKKGEGPDFQSVVDRFRLTIEGDRYHSEATPGTDAARGTVRLDASKTPKHITMIREDAKQTKGIYEFHGGTLRLCMGQPGHERPEAFKTEPNQQAVLLILKRAP